MDKSIHELHELGTQLFEEGKYSEAELILKNVVSANPKYADVHNKLGVISHLKGDSKQAAEYFKKALEINPSYT
jgi:Tfp pilus assembly protein PilF